MAKDKPRVSALNKAIQQAMGDNRTFGLPDDPAREKWPEIWEWMTQVETADGHIMQPASISFVLGPEGVIVTLTHRDLKMGASISVPHLHMGMDALESALAGPNPPLRFWGKDLPYLKKKRPK